MMARAQRRAYQMSGSLVAGVAAIVEQQMMQAGFGENGWLSSPPRQPHLLKRPSGRQVNEVAGRTGQCRRRERAGYRLLLHFRRSGVREDARASAGCASCFGVERVRFESLDERPVLAVHLYQETEPS